jgi:hypothetical protein
MANMIHKFRDRDIQRVLKACRSAGLDPVAVEVDPNTGRIKVTGRKGEASSPQNPWDAADYAAD